MAFVLNETQYFRLKKDLDDFLVNSEASSVLLCDRGGNILISSGQEISESADLISALVAGAFAATKELAAVIGEDEFTAIFHQGRKTSIFITSVGEEVLLLALFNDNTNVGLVKMYALTTCRRLTTVVHEAMTGEEVRGHDPTASFVVAKGPITFHK